MPLDPASLQSSLESLFSNPPATRAACAQAWGDAIQGYALAIVPPSSTVAAACAALAAALESAFALPSAASAFDAAFTACGATIASGMVFPFLSTPPPAPLGIASQLAVIQSTHAAAAAAFTTLIDLWFRTGTIVIGLVPWS
jgi:hypothetical protein